jgi:hypothetical protein
MPRSQRPRKRHNRMKTLVAPTDKRRQQLHRGGGSRGGGGAGLTPWGTQ